MQGSGGGRDGDVRASKIDTFTIKNYTQMTHGYLVGLMIFKNGCKKSKISSKMRLKSNEDPHLPQTVGTTPSMARLLFGTRTLILPGMLPVWSQCGRRGGMAMGLSCRGLWRWCSPDWRNSQIAPVSTGVMTSWCRSSMGVGGATAVWTSGGSCWCSHSLPVDRGFLQVARILPHTYPLKSDDPSNVRAVIVVTAVINDWEMD